MAKPTKNELEIMVENLRELVHEKNTKLNNMAKDRVELNGEIVSLNRGRNELSAFVCSIEKKITLARSALDTIQATCVSVSTPDGQNSVPGAVEGSSDETLLHIIAHLRFILREDN